MENTLDLDKSKTLTIDDIVFEDTEVISSTTPVATVAPQTVPVVPELEVTDTSSEQTEATKVVKPSFDDLDFTNDVVEPASTVETPADAEATVKKPLSDRDVTVTAIRSLLKEKLVRNKLDPEELKVDEMSEEDLLGLEEDLDEAILDARWNSYKSVDKNVEKLMSYLENGGSPKDLVSLFKEQDTLNKIDITNENGQAEMIRSYYSNILGWDSEKTEKKLERLSASGMLAEEASDVEESYNEHFERKQADLLQIQQQKVLNLQARERQKRQIFDSSLVSNKIPKRMADELTQTAFGKGVIKGTNEEISILDYKIMQMQSNPDMFLKLVQFATDPLGYDAMVLQGKKNDEVSNGLKREFQVPTASKSTESAPVKSQARQKFKFNL